MGRSGPGLTAQAWFEWKVLDKTCTFVNSIKSQSPYKPFLCRTNLMMVSCTMVICLVAATILSGAEALKSHSLSHNGNIKELENVRYQREALPVGGYDKIPKAKGKKAKKVKKENKRNSKRKSRKKGRAKKKGGDRRIKEKSSKKGA